jgi:hypothetical protein
MNRADYCLLRTIVADRLTGRADATGNAGVRDRLTLPDRCDDLVLRDHVIAISDKMDKQGKHLRLQPHRSFAVAELKSLRVEPKVTE